MPSPTNVPLSFRRDKTERQLDARLEELLAKLRKNRPSEDPWMVRRAYEIAAERHRDQLRTSGDPYLSHLLEVAHILADMRLDTTTLTAALLHDVVEDCGGAPMLQEVRRRFGERVAKVVDGCTDSDADPKPPWRQRKQDYISHLKSADDDTRLVSAADKLNNVRSILADYRESGESIWSRFNGARDGTLWYYRALLDVFLRGQRNRVVRELELAVTELEHLCKESIPARDRAGF